MSTDMFPDAFIEHVISNPIEYCSVDGKVIKTMTFKGTGFCSVECRKKAGDDVSSVGTHMFVTASEKRIIDAFRKGDGLTIDGRRLTRKKNKS